EQGGTHICGRRVKEYAVLRIAKRSVEIGGEAGDVVGIGKGCDLVLLAPDQDGIRHHMIAVLEGNPALFADFEDGADEMLIGTHPPSDAVHHDAEARASHAILPKVCQGELSMAPRGCQTLPAALRWLQLAARPAERAARLA